MSYDVVVAADFGAANAGLTVYGKLFGTDGAQVGSTITSGFVEAVAGLYIYTLSAPDGQEGMFVAYDSANTALRRVVVIAPRETENSDAKISTRSTVTTTQVNAEVDTALADVGLTTTVTGRIDVASSTLATASALSTVSAAASAIKAVTDLLPDGGALTTLLANVLAILADTNELQADWVNGGRLDLLIDSIKIKTDNLPIDPADASDVAVIVNAAQSAIIADTGATETAILAAIDVVPTTSEVVTAMQAVADDFKADVSGLATQTSVDSLPGTSAIVAAIMAYAVETGHSLDTVMKALYAGIRGKSVADDGDDPTSVAYYAPDNSTVRFTHTLTDTTRTVT